MSAEALQTVVDVLERRIELLAEDLQHALAEHDRQARQWRALPDGEKRGHVAALASLSAGRCDDLASQKAALEGALLLAEDELRGATGETERCAETWDGAQCERRPRHDGTHLYRCAPECHGRALTPLLHSCGLRAPSERAV